MIALGGSGCVGTGRGRAQPPSCGGLGGSRPPFPSPTAKTAAGAELGVPGDPSPEIGLGRGSRGGGRFSLHLPQAARAKPTLKSPRSIPGCRERCRGLPEGERAGILCPRSSEAVQGEAFLSAPHNTPALHCLSCRKSLIYPNTEQSHAGGRWNPKGP